MILTTPIELKLADVELGDNYSAASGSAYIVGTNLRVYFTATRSSASNVGNIDNEIICTLKFEHQNKLKNVYNVALNNGTVGGLVSMQTSDLSMDETYLYISIILTATHAATTSINSYFSMPITFNLAGLMEEITGGTD